MRRLKSFAVSVAAGIAAMLLWVAGTAVLHGHFDLQFAADMVAIALIAGLSVLVALLLREGGRLASDLQRLERAALPDWLRDIAQLATRSGIKVLRVDANVVFESSAGDTHVEAANPPGDGLGHTLARQRVLTILEQWGVPINRNDRGQRIAA
jgi:hypothetical protein